MKKILFFMVFVTFILFGCNKDKGTGTLGVYLTDAPATYDKVEVDVQGLKIHVSGTEEEDDDGWLDLELKEDAKGPVNLLELTDGASIWLAEEELPVGNIAQMRLILGSNNKITVDGIPHDLDTPSAQQSGLKFNIHATIEEGKTYVLYIDFDAEKSVVSNGDGTYSLKPVLTAMTEEQVQSQNSEGE